MKVTNIYPETTTQEEWDDLALIIHKYLTNRRKKLKEEGKCDTINSDSVCCVQKQKGVK